MTEVITGLKCAQSISGFSSTMKLLPTIEWGAFPCVPVKM